MNEVRVLNRDQMKKTKEKAPEKLFVVRKFVKATSASQAILIEKTQEPDEVYLDENWKNSKGGLADAIGFHIPDDQEEVTEE